MTRYLLANLKDGRGLQSVPVMTGPWGTKLGNPDDVSVTIDLRDSDVQALDLRNIAAKAKTILAAVEGDTIMAAGPVWADHYDRDAATLKLDAKGIRSIFDHRYVLPVVAATTPLTGWLTPDPKDPSKTVPNPSLATVYSGVSYATMAKRLIQQALSWTNGNLPIDLSGIPDEVAAGIVQSWEGVDFTTLRAAIDNLSNLDGGPEIEFRPRFTADKLGIVFAAQMGTTAQPQVFSAQRPRWNVTAPETPVSGFTTDGDATVLASNSWAMGGRSGGTVLVSRATSSGLTDAGFPLLEVSDSSHSSVDRQPTLDSYARQNLADSQAPIETWAFTADAYPVDENGNQAGPQVGSYQTGDYAELHFDKFVPASEDGKTPQRGDPYLRSGNDGQPYVHRILALSGDEKGVAVKVSTAPQGMVA